LNTDLVAFRSVYMKQPICFVRHKLEAFLTVSNDRILGGKTEKILFFRVNRPLGNSNTSVPDLWFELDYCNTGT
jgi:hypothetical protein